MKFQVNWILKGKVHRAFFKSAYMALKLQAQLRNLKCGAIVTEVR